LAGDLGADPIGDDELDGYERLVPVADRNYAPMERKLRQAIARLIGEVLRLRDVMRMALNALETDEVAARRAAFERIQDHFEGVTAARDHWIDAAADEIAGDPSCTDAPDRIADIIRGHKERGA
jgi:hypothetical protein